MKITINLKIIINIKMKIIINLKMKIIINSNIIKLFVKSAKNLI